MTYTPSALYARPLFGEALDGKFIAAQEPEGPIRTLGGLAFDTFDKGFVCVNMDAWDQRVYSYNLPWAPGVLATAACDLSHGVVDLKSIALTNSLGRRLKIADVSSSEDDQKIRMLCSGQPGVTKELQPDAELIETQNMLASVAQLIIEDVLLP